MAAMTPNPNPGLAILADGERLADPRGVRVTLAPASADAGLPGLIVEPQDVPRVPDLGTAGQELPGDPHVVARIAAGADPEGAPLTFDAAAEPMASAGSYVLVNGQPVAASLDRLDAERAILVRVGETATRTPVLLLPATAIGGAKRGVARREVVVDGWRVELEVEPAARAALRERARRGREELGESGPTEVRAIIPGVVVSVSVAAGDAVSAGQQLLVVEAMKMQNELRAPRDGTVERLAVAAGRTIEVGDLLLVLA